MARQGRDGCDREPVETERVGGSGRPLDRKGELGATVVETEGLSANEIRVLLGVALSATEAQSDPALPGYRGETLPGVAEFDAGSVGGRVLGQYELVGVLGRGGMGVVYRARQIGLNRDVALKLIKADDAADLAALRRFRNEAEAVAALDHDHIVPIYEVGIQGVRHYFSMKLIEGSSLDHRLEEHKGAYRASARLVATVAEAVQHAHERGILHRDLKPSNILIDAEGRPHVTDFGLARRVSEDPEQSLNGGIVGSPPYMAPEQATAQRGGLTIATDVYGLGAILYALLTGLAPHRGTSILETLEMVRLRPPEPPSTVDPKVPRDLERICLKCLEMEPKHRYGSALALADDLRRWLDGRPIAARPVGALARAWMWSRRKPALAGLSTALTASLVVALGAIVANAIQVRHRRDLLARANEQLQAANLQTTRERDASRGLVDFMTRRMLTNSSLLYGVNELGGTGARTITLEKMLDLASELVGMEYPDQPKLEALMRQTLGRTYRRLGKFAKAESELARSRALLDPLPAEFEDDRLATLHELAQVRLDQARPAEAEPLARAALDGRRVALGEDDRATLESSIVMAMIERALGRGDEAMRRMEANRAAATRSLPEVDDLRLRVIIDLGLLHYDRGEYRQSEAIYREALDGLERAGRGEGSEALIVEANLGAALLAQRRLGEAEALLTSSAESARRFLGADHPLSIEMMSNLAASRFEQGKAEEAARIYREVVEIREASLGKDDAKTIEARNSLANALRGLGRFDEAEAMLRAVLAWRVAHQPVDDIDRIQTEMNLGELLIDRGRFVQAAPIFDRSVRVLEKSLPAGHPLIVYGRSLSAVCLLEDGHPAEAAAILREVVRAREALYPPDSWQIANPKSRLGACLAALGDFPGAEPLLLAGYEALSKASDAPPRRVTEALERVIRLYEAWPKPEQAAAFRARRVKAPVVAP